MAIVPRILAVEAALAAILFTAAGRMDLPWFWAVLALHATLMAAGMLAIDPDLRKERLRPGPGGTSRRVRFFALPLVLAHLVVAGMDVGRFGWSGPMPVAVQAGALLGYAAGMGLSIWAMAANRFFSPVVRIQAERGHHVVSSGPYRFLRHPGYTGLLVGTVCGGIALGSWWSLLPLVPLVALFLHRTALEDRFLREGLVGYADYARRVRFRLVPGLW
ncbi:methyltransferase family protein [Tautonia plasticadhaerens]|uniref:Isoprenylcysteine carboxyl methyltransferase (ICMT) family protein n=1 Tax=Tautonia plasticadhaerens TaxID=2527974 RepID=A0A518H3T6_9BACT|nr:isoprenylcysteine carboxylmethyltransferase family protein [Tautonia plasticadhaerens]QDV35515.1 Isoprenylcysteine carboxyl methyltransferase (ICMT) family protein [Tautonia plasticadhaerens]